MRAIAILLTVLVLNAPVAISQKSELPGGGISFFKGNWEEALTKAKKENKLIFVDAYTVWCGPCKWMNANVFTDGSVGEFYNSNFINVKLDMERGEGKQFAAKYGVRAYPTLLYINGSGEVVHKALGAKKPDQFLEVGKTALAQK